MRLKKAEEAGDLAAKGEAFLAENATHAGVQVTDSGLQYEIITAGRGAVPTPTCRVRTHYADILIEGTEFDRSYKRGQPAEFPLNGVIAGWTEALHYRKSRLDCSREPLINYLRCYCCVA